MSATILVVDDDAATRKMIQTALVESGFEVVQAATAAEAMAAVQRQEPDVMLLDLILPDGDGVEICRQVRTFSNVSIIMVTAKRDLTDRLAGLDAGADDYVTKPLAMGELVARIKSLLRRLQMRKKEPVREIAFGDVTLDCQHGRMCLPEQSVDMSEIEMSILRALADADGKPVTSDALCDRVWGPGRGDPIVLEAHIANIRHKIEENPSRPRRLVSEPGDAYRLVKR
ncbi:MAG: response regulator transcription factor [Armatimonadetes bacterium]|nr:response regulator transcription factor [Armatimonadota bacterium]